YQAVQKPQYQHLVDDALQFAIRFPGDRAARTEAFMDQLLINFGCEILKIIPGRVSTEVDAGLSFDTEGTLSKARKLIGMYEKADVGRERVLIKIASTWEGIRAAEQLEREGIHCNLTLLFSFAQAVACAEAKSHLDEKTFRWMHNEDAMAVEKLSEGVRKFHADTRRLEQYVRETQLPRVLAKESVVGHQ